MAGGTFEVTSRCMELVSVRLYRTVQLRTLAFRAFSRRLISADAITATFRIRTQQ